MVLQAIEKRLHGPKQEALTFSGLLTIEHVWPQNPKEGTWPILTRKPDGTFDFDAMAKRDRLRHSVGNLTLVTPAFNSSLSNAAYIDKQPAITRESLLMNAYFQNVPKEAGGTKRKSLRGGTRYLSTQSRSGHTRRRASVGRESIPCGP